MVGLLKLYLHYISWLHCFRFCDCETVENLHSSPRSQNNIIIDFMIIVIIGVKLS